MKALLLVLLMVLVPASGAQNIDEDKFITYDPAVNLGVGLALPAQNNSSTYAMVVVKGYLWTMGFPREIGMQVLGLGGALSADGSAFVVFSPMTYFIGPVGVGPELLFPATNQVNYGMSLSYRF